MAQHSTSLPSADRAVNRCGEARLTASANGRVKLVSARSAGPAAGRPPAAAGSPAGRSCAASSPADTGEPVTKASVLPAQSQSLIHRSPPASSTGSQAASRARPARRGTPRLALPSTCPVCRANRLRPADWEEGPERPARSRPGPGWPPARRPPRPCLTGSGIPQQIMERPGIGARVSRSVAPARGLRSRVLSPGRWTGPWWQGLGCVRCSGHCARSGRAGSAAGR